ncbi:Cyclic nucleotide-gated cation channel subunit A [Folsomia candida]|uniref:Cyclic nucleotide-gated cation channel subunit A n=1 Tax=Folsomia candida TaxID=158441 RepID=A0A226E5I6_FOLCA|nr:Cyclic nucleotide-gated cation channel subunit A [Folsomia candida]
MSAKSNPSTKPSDHKLVPFNEKRDPELNSESQTAENDAKVPKLRLTVALLQNFYNWTKKTTYVAPSATATTPKWWSRQALLHAIVVDPSNSFQYGWIAITSIAILYNMIFILGRATFWQLQNAIPTIWLYLDGITDIIYYLDSVIHAHEAYLEDGLMVKEIRKLHHNYFHSRNFTMDVLSLIPLNLDLPFSSNPVTCASSDVPCYVILRINRLLKLHRFNEFLTKMETRTAYPNLLQIANVVLYILLIIHWNSCFYFWLSNHIGFGTDEWVFPNVTQGGKAARLGYQYSYCVYWSTLILTRISEVTLPDFRSDIEHIFVVVELFGGVIIFAIIVGNVGSVVINMTETKTEFQNTMDSIKEYLKFQKVSKDLEKRVITWFDYLMSRKQMFNEDKVLTTLPQKLRMEIAMSLHLGTLKRIEMFQDCDPGLLTELVLKLRLQVFSPGDYICLKGDVGKEMYIVRRGAVSVVADDGKTIYVTLKSGSVFGEISLLNIVGSKTGNRRTANVRSVGYSDLFILSKDDLWATLREYPEAQTALTNRGKAMLIKSGLLQESDSKMDKELGTQEERVESLELMIKTLDIRLNRLSNQYSRTQQKCKTRLENVG